MWAVLVIVGITGIIGYLALRKPKVKPKVAPAPPLVAAPTFSNTVEAIAVKMPTRSLGETFIHNETREKVRLVAIEPNVDSGEYHIEWPSGAVGKIHEAQLKEWFTEI